MITGHESHQVGLDADIWLTPMPNRLLTGKEREDLMATSMLKDPFTVDMKLWTPWHTKLIKRAASYPEVERIFVHPAIKRVLCEQAGTDRSWLSKVRPWWGHTTISMCASPAQQVTRTARASHLCLVVMTAALNSMTGSRSCVRQNGNRLDLRLPSLP